MESPCEYVRSIPESWPPNARSTGWPSYRGVGGLITIHLSAVCLSLNTPAELQKKLMLQQHRHHQELLCFGDSLLASPRRWPDHMHAVGSPLPPITPAANFVFPAARQGLCAGPLSCHHHPPLDLARPCGFSSPPWQPDFRFTAPAN